MLESRSAYGYYGTNGSASGETTPITHKNGWGIRTYRFEIAGTFEQKGGCHEIEVRACDYDHAIKQIKRWARRDGFSVVGDAKGWEQQSNWVV